jgi:hypothetical protein
MPRAVNEALINPTEEEKRQGVKALVSMDPASPPTKEIPFMEFPRVVYKHPTKPYQIKEHRNTHHEVVHVEKIPSEHISKLVADKKELEAAMKDGFVKEPYLPAPPADPNEDLYA